jgi:hypothetical protein
MWNAIADTANRLEAMAEGRSPPLIFVSCLDPGVGKTAAITHFLRALVASPEHEDVGVLVCFNRLEQIEEFVAAANLPSDDVAIFTSDDDVNAKGAERADTARVLLTTHSMLRSRCRARRFTETEVFHFFGRVHDVRIWDESIMPALPLTLPRDAVASLLDPLRGQFPDLARDLETFFVSLADAVDGAVIAVPDFRTRHRLSPLEAVDRLGKNAGAHLKEHADTLSRMQGRKVVVRHDGAYGPTLVDHEDALPRDIAPLLVFDASARLRATYRHWHKGGALQFLAYAPKSYERLTVHLWKRGGGKRSFAANIDTHVEGIATTILLKPNEPWLVVCHGALAGIDIEARVRSRLWGKAIEAHFITWGRHDATNRFAHVPNVILAGTVFYRTSHYEGLWRAACGSIEAATEADLAGVRAGETAHHILQAACRGIVRRCVDGGCPPANLYIIASGRSGVQAMLPKLFPGAKIVPWEPVQRPLSGVVGEAVRYLDRRINAENADRVTMAEVMKAVGWSDKANFRRNVRRHRDFVPALRCIGLIETTDRGFVAYVRNPFVDENEVGCEDL